MNDAERPGAAGAEEVPGDGRLVQAVQTYLQELEKGGQPSRSEWLARFPDLGDELNECLEGLDLIHRAAASLGSSHPSNAAPGVGLQAGKPIGDFQILRELGRGGMGIIYEAIQMSLGRRVAVKVLPFAAGFDAKCLQRFRQEAQAAAQLHHNHIVPVYAVGCERGVHFYAMQLIDGLSLDRVVERLRSDAGQSPRGTGSGTSSLRSWLNLLPGTAPTEPLPGSDTTEPAEEAESTTNEVAAETLAKMSADFTTQHGRSKKDVYRTVARLMVQAADALEYAHQQGIIHRDIKPANLLVDSKQSLWITDFGLAHLHGEQNLTRTGDLLGTIRYASPEQVSGQRVVLDHRTDLYSLGATFYELLTLRPLFAGTARHAVLHMVLNQEPASPRSIDRSIPVELETILLKLLAKNSAERYNSAQELGDDLRRFLRDEPILARPPTPVERLRKWGRRHPSFVVAVVLVMFVTLVISGVSNWLVAQANSRTRDALNAERTRAEEAERRFSQARQAVDFLIDVSENDLADKPHLQQLRKRLLEAALVYYQDFLAQNGDNPQREAELAAVQRHLRKVLDDLSVIEGAGQLVLLREKSVQDDLALGETERQQIGAISRRISEQQLELLRDYHRLTADQRREQFLEFARDNERAIRSILTEAQVRRLRQIRIQLLGILAFSEPDVVATLALADEQRSAIRQIETETFAPFMMMRPPEEPPGEFRPRGEPNDEPRRERRPRGFHDDLSASAVGKVLSLLTPEQLSQWQQMTGPAFSGRLPGPPPGGFPMP